MLPGLTSAGALGRGSVWAWRMVAAIKESSAGRKPSGRAEALAPLWFAVFIEISLFTHIIVCHLNWVRLAKSLFSFCVWHVLRRSAAGRGRVGGRSGLRCG